MKKEKVETKEHDDVMLNDIIVGKHPDITELDVERERKNNESKYLIAHDPIALLKILPSSIDKWKKNILASNINGDTSLVSLPKPKVLNLLDSILDHVEDIKKQALAEAEKEKVQDFTIVEHLTTIEPLNPQKLNEESMYRLILQMQDELEKCIRILDSISKHTVAFCGELDKNFDIKTDDNEK